MTIKLNKTWGETNRPCRYEVRVELVDSASGAVYNEVITSKKRLAPTELDAAIADRIAALDALLNQYGGSDHVISGSVYSNQHGFNFVEGITISGPAHINQSGE